MALAGAAPSKRLETLQAGRALAAFAVVLYHLNGSIFGKEKYFSDPIHPLLSSGRFGVEFFFVLSGFLMVWLYGRRLGDINLAIHFTRSRFTRIYPIYWIVTALVIPVYFISPSAGHGHETKIWSIITSFALVPTVENPILQVAWTLQFEVFFYVMFAGIIAFPRALGPIFTIWGLGIVINSACNIPLPFPFSFVFSPMCALFLVGGIAAIIVRNGVPMPALWAVAGLACLSGTVIADVYFSLPRVTGIWLYGLSAALAIIGLIILEIEGRISVPPILSYLGDASYAIYLTHLATMSLLVKVMFHFGVTNYLPRLASALFLVAASIVVAILIHEYVEKPLLSRMSQKRRTHQ